MFDDLQKKEDKIDDIFADTDKEVQEENFSFDTPPATPKEEPVEEFSNEMNLGAEFRQESSESSILRKLVIVIIALLLLAVGAYFIYSKLLLPQSIMEEEDAFIIEEEEEEDVFIIEEEESEFIIEEDPFLEEEEVDIEYLKSIDSDNDGLSDYDEIYIFGTDPLNPDTDGDGYFDGSELLNGYSPLDDGVINPLDFENPDLFYEVYADLVEELNL